MQKLRKVFHNPAFTTDVICGFPGETEEEFQITKQFLKDNGFYEVHLFPYSRREGTKADKMEGQLLEAVKKERVKELSGVVAQLKAAFEQDYIGKQTDVLIEEETVVAGKRVYKGHTPEYIEVCYEGEAKPGQIVSGILKPSKLAGGALLLDGNALN